jgi:hypothetical protein
LGQIFFGTLPCELGRREYNVSYPMSRNQSCGLILEKILLENGNKRVVRDFKSLAFVSRMGS